MYATCLSHVFWEYGKYYKLQKFIIIKIFWCPVPSQVVVKHNNYTNWPDDDTSINLN